jgi:hypothetical protein
MKVAFDLIVFVTPAAHREYLAVPILEPLIRRALEFKIFFESVLALWMCCHDSDSLNISTAVPPRARMVNESG